MKHIDVRSDTGTELTQQMRQAILVAHYGDHLYGEDLNVLKLEKKAAQMFGKEAASFVVSGTFGNQASVMAAGIPGTEILLCDKSHMINYENGSIGRLSRMMARTLPGDENLFISEEVLRSNIRKVKDMQAPKQTIFSLQNPTCMGRIYPIEQFNSLIHMAKEAGMHVHLDGARIFNACEQLGIQPKQLVKDCDSVMFCLSKGLCLPIGSIVVGSRQFIDKFNSIRKMLGGMLRKPGQIAAMGLIALDKMRVTFKKDHEMAKLLGKRIKQELPWMQVCRIIETNMVFYQCSDDRISLTDLQAYLRKHGIISTVNPSPQAINRLMCNHHIREQQIETIINTLKGYYEMKCSDVRE